MKTPILILLIFVSVVSWAQETEKIDGSVSAFSEAMGLDSLLEATIEQTRAALQDSMKELSASIKAEYPQLSSQKINELEGIFTTYVDTVVESIDVEHAIRIYSSVIANGLPPATIESATNYYQTAEGQELQRVIGDASKQLNEYVLDQVKNASKVAKANLSEALNGFIVDAVGPTEE